MVFYDVAYVEVQPIVKGRSVTVKLKDFGVYYRQDDIDALAGEMKNGGSKVTVETGQVVKITKDKKGIVKREVLTKSMDRLDRLLGGRFRLREPQGDRSASRKPTRRPSDEVWTGGYIFENEWQCFRTRKDRTLELTSAPHEYAAKGRYKIAVKVIDIFGNDTTKVVEVTV